MNGRYELHAHIDATSPEQLATTLRAIAHHVEADHDLTGPGEVVNTITAGDGQPSWSVRVTHELEEHARAG